MATEEENVRLAEVVARNLSGVKRNDWQRWVNLTHEYSLENAVKIAAKLSEDQTLRPNIRFANRAVAKGVESNILQLRKLAARDLACVFGYVGQFLLIAQQNNKGQPGSQQR